MKSNNHLSTKIALAAMLLGAAIYAGSLNAAPSPTPNPHASMPGMSSPAPSSPPMTMGNDKMMMGKMDQMMQMMGKMMPMMEKMMGPSANMKPDPSSMSMMDDDNMEMSGMMGMTAMGKNTAMAASALPGFPGASHLYHIGATGFFLDHPEHITLTSDQQVGLNKIKDQAMLAKSASDRDIEKAEQELGTLTAADQPDVSKIEAKVRDIAKMAGDQRIVFIRAVGEAAKILTPDQRKMLTGFMAPAPAPAPGMNMPSASTSPTPMPMNDM